MVAVAAILIVATIPIAAACTAGWFAWLYFVPPQSDIERIKAEQAGTGNELLEVRRVATKPARSTLRWLADQSYLQGGGWYRIYDVVVARPDGLRDNYSVGVGAGPLGPTDLRRIDLRAGLDG